MFKVGIIGDEASQDFQTVVDMAVEFNLNSIEIRSVWEKAPQELTDQDIDKMKQILKDTDVEVIGIASPFYKCDIDNTEERKEHLNILKKCIKLAKAFDVNLIRTFVFWKIDNIEERWNEIVRSYDEPVRIAEASHLVWKMSIQPT